MSTPAEAVALGLPPADKEFLDLSTAQIIRRRVSPADRSMTREAASAFQRGDITGPSPAPEPDFSAAAPPTPVVPAQAAIPVPAAAPAVPAAPVAPTAVPGAPVSDTYPKRANDRINKLYGQRMEALEYAQQLEAKFAETNRRLDALLSRQAPGAPAPTAPYTNQYGSSHSGFGAPADGTPPAGDYVSRAEMQAILDRERSLVSQAFELTRSHDAARAEAFTDFPDVFGDPELRSAADRILASDPYLRQDPKGPYKAAALARGLSVSESREAAAALAAADVRKAAISGVGPSVAEGNGPPADRVQRYRQAMAYAAQTQRPEDFTRARLIQLGQA